jgi:hypothetical protein
MDDWDRKEQKNVSDAYDNNLHIYEWEMLECNKLPTFGP